MSRFHINSKGDPGRCRAQNGNCPFGSAEEHYDSEADARKAFEASMMNSGSSLDPKAPSTWPIGEDNANFHAILDARFNRVFGAQEFTLRTRKSSWDGSTLDWEVTILSKAGAPVGNIRRLIVPGDFANNEWMSLEYEARGQGFASEFTPEYEQWLKELKVKEVRVYAASNPAYNEEHTLDGALRWAKTFDWDKKPLDVLSECWTALEEDDFTPEEEESITNLLERFDTEDETQWPSPRELAGLGPNELGERLLSKKVAWYGKRSLSA